MNATGEGIELALSDDDLLRRFSETPERRRLTETTNRTCHRALRSLGAVVTPRPLSKTTHDDMQLWLDGLPPRGHLAAVRAFYRWAVVEGIVRVDPTVAPRAPVAKITDPDALRKAAMIYVAWNRLERERAEEAEASRAAARPVKPRRKEPPR